MPASEWNENAMAAFHRPKRELSWSAAGSVEMRQSEPGQTVLVTTITRVKSANARFVQRDRVSHRRLDLPETHDWQSIVLVQHNRVSAVCAAVSLLACALPGFCETVQVANRELALAFDLGDLGIQVSSIRNKVSGVEHLVKPSSLFEVSVDGFPIQSDHGIFVDHFSRSADGSKLTIESHATDQPLRFEIEVSLTPNDPVALVRIQMTNTGKDLLAMRAIVPKIANLKTAGPSPQRMGMVSQEIGAVVPLEKTAPPGVPVGMRSNPRIGLPTGMNSMEVASIFDGSSGGGIFFADVDGDLDNDIAPIEFVLSSAGVSGSWVSDLAPGQAVSVPRFAIGVHNTGDWHVAVDYYVAQHRPRWHFPQVPAWLRDDGAMYSYSGSGSGGIYMQFPRKLLKDSIGTFANLPKLLEDARSLGTSVLFLADYWDGGTLGERREYFNKGDYIPRTDMGGPVEFTKGIDAVHQLGGRVIVYVEAFIISTQSEIGREHGEQWAGRDAGGNLYTHYRNNYSMITAHKPWQDHLVKVCERLVRDYGVDGIFLDSAAWQTNWRMQNLEEGVLYSSKQYSQGFLTIADRIRKAIQAIKPDAVVVGETTAGPIARHWDGGLSADFAWLAAQNQNRIIASPIRYGVPEVNFYSNGRNLNEFNQVYAAGHNLALCFAQLPEASYIKPLVEIRQRYKDALIHGKQTYQPVTGRDDVAAYVYQGSANRVITAVNISSEQVYDGELALRSSEANSAWQDLRTGETFRATKGRLPLKIDAQGLRVLLLSK